MSLRCPSCQSNKFYYVERAFNYHTASNFSERYNELIELVELADSLIDETFQNKFYCGDCGTEFSVHGVMITPPPKK